VVTLAAVCAVASSCGSAGGEPYRTVAGGDPARGAKAVATYGCGSCHVIPGIRQAYGVLGPPLVSFGRHTVLAGQVVNSADQLVLWIVNPQRIKPATAMPNLGVTADDARDIAAYLYTLR